jgi:hypothetical protein
MVDLEIWRELAANAWPCLGIIPKNQEFVSASYLSPSPQSSPEQGRGGTFAADVNGSEELLVGGQISAVGNQNQTTKDGR